MLGMTLWSVTTQQRSLSQLQFQAGGVSLDLYPDQENGRYCLFLPAFASPDDLTVSHAGMGTVDFDWEEGVLPLDQDVAMTISFPWGARDQYALRLMQCSANHTICIQTQDGTMALIDEDQSNEASVSVAILDKDGKSQYTGHANISGRGNGTWDWPKKPYDLKFPTKITAGGFEAVDKLCLLAEYVDESKLRNALAYHTGALLDIPYHSGYTFADVYIDGVYNGIYAMTTKREYTKHIADHGIQSVFELSSSNKGDYFYTDNEKQIRIHHGAQAQILDAVEVFEEALLDRDWDALWQAADLTSWARKYALDEFFYNYDLPLTSQYFYLDGEGTIKCMLPWDYEWVFYPRMSPYDMQQEKALAAYYSHGNWYEILLESEAFRQAVAAVYREEFTPGLFTAMETYLNQCIQELTGSWHCDRYRWHANYAAGPRNDGGKGLMAHYTQQFLNDGLQRHEFLTGLMEDFENHHLLLFFWEQDGIQHQCNLEIIVPNGTPMSDYTEKITTTLTNLNSGTAPVSCVTQDGTPLEEVGTIEKDLTISVVYP